MEFNVIEILEVASVGIATALIGTFYLARENAKKIDKQEKWAAEKDKLDQEQEKELIRLNEKVNGVESLIVQKIEALQTSFEAFAKSIEAKMKKYDKEFEDFWKNKPWEK